jgi:hypothetical protein
MHRRQFLTLTMAASLSGGSKVMAASALPAMTVHKTPECGCCAKWVEHMRAAGFKVTVNEVGSTAIHREQAGVPRTLAACHTALVGGYTVEGHVPAADIKKLLAQRPAARGLVVPQMPQTSPGMDRPHGEAWDVLLLAEDGTTRVFTHYRAQ